ncbi:MAG: hypothetical protein HY739_08530 [Desulfobacterales bacterium]|nr:hypothetical protein [Desulfobacterales bacterium]
MEVKNNKTSLVLYGNLLSDIKTRIRQAQVKATLSANSEMILMYWDIGRMIQERQDHEGWGTAVIPRLARDIRNELPEEKGFSERNIKRMLRFYREYPNILPIMPQAVAQLQQAENKDVLKVPQAVAQLPVNEHSVILQRLVEQIPWGHNILLMERVKDLSSRFWYMEQTIQNGWSRDVLGIMIKNTTHNRQGKAVSNFSLTLPDPQDTAGIRCPHGKLK